MKNRIIKTLAIKPFSFLLLAEIFSQLAINMLNFMLLIVAFSLAGSNTAVSGVLLSFTIPALLFGLLAGIYVDNWNKKKVLIYTNVARAVLVLFLAFFHSNLVLIYVITFGASFISQFFIPAETPMIPVLVKKELLLPANALFGIIIYASIIISYALAGPIILLIGETKTFFVVVSFFALAAIFASLIKIEIIKKKKNYLDFRIGKITRNIIWEIRNAFSMISRTALIFRALFLLSIIQVLILVLAVIGPGFAKEVLNIKVEEFPLFFVTPFIMGMALGALMIGGFFHHRLKNKLTKIGLFLIGITILLLPYGSNVESREIVQTVNFYLPHLLKINMLHIMVVLAFIMGFANSLIFVPSNAILQEETSDEFRGKVYGALNTLVGLFSLLPILIVGALADIIGVKTVLTGIGSIVLLSAVFLFTRSVRKK